MGEALKTSFSPALVRRFSSAIAAVEPRLATLTVGPHETAKVTKNVSLAVHTTRKPNGGRHAVDALINGQRFELGAFIVAKA